MAWKDFWSTGSKWNRYMIQDLLKLSPGGDGSSGDDIREIVERYLICFSKETEARSFSDKMISQDTQRM